MGSISFDTLAYSKTLREAGFSEAQAEALAKAQSNAFAQMLDSKDLATKGDLARLETRLVKAFHNALYGFAGVIIAAIAVAVAILK